jgi:hypothetical protein
MKVFVYFNLHKKLFSVKALEGPEKGRVIAHRNDINLSDVIFKVSEKGRQRVLRELKKNVHAGVVGTWIKDEIKVDNRTQVTYNPYKYNTFVIKENEVPIARANTAYLIDKKIFVS